MKQARFAVRVLAVVLFVCALAAALNAQAAPAGPFAKPWADFQAAVAAREYARALTALRSLLASFWSEAPLLLGNVRFVKGSENTFGVYEPRPGDAFAAGEPIYLYAEPAGYVFRQNPAGFYEFGFKADFQLADESGKVLGGQKDFASLPFRSWSANTEVSITFTYTFSGLEKGKYRIITQVSDLNSAKKAICEKWFAIQ